VRNKNKYPFFARLQRIGDVSR